MDVGANDGSDTWYYLRKGFRVVAIEAIPELVAELTATYSSQIEAGRLTIAPIAIAEGKGKVSFTVNEERTEWSSTRNASKASSGDNRVIEVDTDTLVNVIKSHGKPYYAKIDIEGGELAAIRSLTSLNRNLLPDFLSFEINTDWEEILGALCGIGYRHFQLVRQGSPYLHKPPSPSREGIGYQCMFTSNMSGPFGRDLPLDRWTGIAEIVKQIIGRNEAGNAADTKPGKGGWYDIHANRYAVIGSE